jgi:ATP-dependent Clp endopeptidase proteolytic subunit ClpP
MTTPTKHKPKPKPTKTSPLTEARRRNIEAETRKVLAEATIAEADAQISRHAAYASQLEHDQRNASDFSNHVYRFSGPVTDGSVTACQRTLAAWHRLEPGEDFTIVFNSPGGSVVAGMALFDYLTYLRAEGHHITTVCEGMAASMGGILMQAGDKRVIGKESYLMIHEISAGASGKIGEITDVVKWYEIVCERVANIFIERSKGKCKRDQFVKGWKRQDWWLDSESALKYGFVDEVR